MDKQVVAIFFREGGKLISDGIRVALARPKNAMREEHVMTSVSSPKGLEVAVESSPALTSQLPTREETTRELKRRLTKELYRAELDFAGGLKIAGKPCDCLDNKHTLGLEATAEELISQDPANPVYQEIIVWIRNNQYKVTVAAIESGKYSSEYPRMAMEFKSFRKRVLGTEADILPKSTAKPMTLEEAKEIAATRAKQEVERQWHLTEKK